MNQLKVAFLPELDEMDSASIERVMEVKAPRVSIDRVNWPEFPYKPVVAVSVARSERDLYLLYRVWGNSLKASASQVSHWMSPVGCCFAISITARLGILPSTEPSSA